MPQLNLRLEKIGKKFYQRWLFRDINHDFSESPHLALVGTNGSGKSTLLRIIAGQLAPSEGRIRLTWDDGKGLSQDYLYQHLSWAAPYVELYPELNLRELLDLHYSLKRCRLPDYRSIVDVLDLAEHASKPLRWYSSGMIQRVKVGLAVLTESRLLLLDEPTSNMDEANATRILSLIQEHSEDRILVLASNLDREFKGMEHQIRLSA
ncbi:MAG: ATP-binding cassette domain-containing protein [Bacteroidota bacterium]